MFGVLENAKEFATHAHDGQKRKNGDPYITHPAAVVSILEGMGVTCQDTLAVGWLHDVVEDTHISQEDILSIFTNPIPYGLSLLTHHKAVSYYDYICELNNKYWRIVKIADLKHNMSDLNRSSLRDKYEFALRMLLKAEKKCPFDHNH